MNTTNNLFSLERNREIIFLDSVKELYNRTRSNQRTPYNLIRIGAILRFLVIDGSKFYQTINIPYKLKNEIILVMSRNESHSLSTFEEPNGYFAWNKYKVDLSGEKITLQKFLSLPVMKINNPQLREFLDKDHIAEEYSISELIKLIANAHGGVHIENWGEIPGNILTDSSSPFNINSNSKLYDILFSISDIIYIALEPLSNAVFKNVKSIRAISWEVSQVFTVASTPPTED